MGVGAGTGGGLESKIVMKIYWKSSSKYLAKKDKT